MRQAHGPLLLEFALTPIEQTNQSLDGGGQEGIKPVMMRMIPIPILGLGSPSIGRGHGWRLRGLSGRRVGPTPNDDHANSTQSANSLVATTMSKTWLISGPPGCGKTTWILNTMQSHPGSCGYLRLEGYTDEGLEQATDTGIDLAFLQDQIPQLRDLTDPHLDLASQPDDLLALIEVPQFRPPKESGLIGIDPRVKAQLEAFQLLPDRHLHFGQEPELPKRDTLEFSKLESWTISLHKYVWDPSSLNSFWFELVNGAYGDVYRAKALMNLPDGRAFFCNWMMTQDGSQFLPLQAVAPPNGRPTRVSELVVQGKALDAVGAQSTIDDCLLNDAVLEMHQAPLRDRQPELTHSR